MANNEQTEPADEIATRSLSETLSGFGEWLPDQRATGCGSC